MSLPAVRIAGLRKAFQDVPVLRGLDLDVPAGELLAVLGASGSGKTTLLRLLAGFERADAGSIELDRRRVAGPGEHLPPERRRIGYVAQEGALFPHLSVGANVLFGLPARARRDTGRAQRLLDLVGLPGDWVARPPHELSGGEQQRVALARALAPDPALVLLDEPFSALDAATRAETRRAVVAALAATGATALLVTHDQAEALSTGGRVAVLRDGLLVQVARPADLYHHPADAALARFVGEAVLLAGRVGGATVTCALGRLPLARPAPDGLAEVLVRPEQVRLRPVSAGADHTATVGEIVYYGHDANVALSLGPGGPAILARVSGHAVPRAGEVVAVTVEGGVVAFPA